MSKIAVQRLAGGDGGRDEKHYLTLLSPEDRYACKPDLDLPINQLIQGGTSRCISDYVCNPPTLLSPETENPSAFEHLHLPIPFDLEHEKILGGCTCRGLLCIADYVGNSVICNPTTKEFKLLHPPADLKPSPNFAIFYTYGFGYDAKSDDFKVLRIFEQYYSSPSQEPDAFHHEFLGSESRSQLYSFKSNAWKEIEEPELFIQGTGVYIEGTSCCYFPPATCGDVLCFNFEDEAFGHHFALPQTTISGGVYYRLVDYGGLLGAITFPRPHDHYLPDPPTSTFEIFARRGGSWHKLHYVSLGHGVERPLGIRDGRFLYMEAMCSPKRGQLIVYDLSTGDLKKLNIYDLRGHLGVYCYDESIDSLPGAETEPMRKLTWTEAAERRRLRG